MAQNGGIRIDPRFIELAGGNSSRASSGGTNWAAAAAQMQADQANKDWDPIIRPIERIFNVITAGGSATMNAIDKSVKGGIESGPIGAIGGGVGGLVNGFFASFNNDPKSENYMTGSKLLESVTDRFGNAYDKDYVDREDNVDPFAKAVVGFATDVAADPLTYVPGGIIASGLRGAFRASKAAEGFAKIPAAAKGIVEGTPGTVKLGRFTDTVKPIGVKEWQAVRKTDKFAKLMRKSGLSEDLMFAVASANGAQRFMTEILPKLRETHGPDYLANLTEESVQKLSDDARSLLPSYEKVTTGAEDARFVASTSIPEEGAAAYKHGVDYTPAVSTRKSTKERSATIQARMADETALKEIEILKLDAENVLAKMGADLDGLVKEREKLATSIAKSDALAQKRDLTAQEAAVMAETTAQIAELTRTIKNSQQMMRRQTAKLGDYQAQWDAVDARSGFDMASADEMIQSIAERTDRAINYVAIKGIDDTGIVGFNTPAHRELFKLDDSNGVHRGASQVMLASLETALSRGIIDDMPLGRIGNETVGYKDVSLKDLIQKMYGAGSENIPGDLHPWETEFYSAVIAHTVDRMWDVVNRTLNISEEMATDTVRQAGSLRDLVEESISEASQSVIEANREVIAGSMSRLSDFADMSAAERALHATEIQQLNAVTRAAEENIRWVENGGAPGLPPFIIDGALKAADEAARIAGVTPELGINYVNNTMQQVGYVRRAIANLDKADIPLEVRNSEVAKTLGKLIEAHSATDESLSRILALIGGEPGEVGKNLIDVLTGTIKPIEAGLSDPAVFGKLVIEVAKLPIELPGISSTARLRARAFADADRLGVYGVEESFSDKAVTAYGNELLRNYENAGGVVLEQTALQGYTMEGIAARGGEAIDELAARQEIPVDEVAAANDIAIDVADDALNIEQRGDVYDPNAEQTGFAMGSTVGGIKGEGPRAALDLFGNIVARGIDTADLETNLEYYRYAALKMVAQQYTDVLEGALTGRTPNFRGEPVDEFLQYWESEYRQFTEAPTSANVFDVAANVPIRGEKVPTPYKRIIETGKDENGKPNKVSPTADALGTELNLDKVAPGATPKNIGYREGEGMPVDKSGRAVIDNEFDKAFPARAGEVPVSQHILGYAKEPLAYSDWLRVIHLASRSSKIAGDFFGRYRGVADRLGVRSEADVVRKIDDVSEETLKSDPARLAYTNYRNSFKGSMSAEKKAGMELVIAEAKKAEGVETGYGKWDTGQMRSAAASNYGVDPLGRLVHDARLFDGEATVADASGGYGWIMKAPKGIDKKKLLAIAAKSKTPEAAIAAIEKQYPTYAAAIIPIMIKSWGNLNRYGLTPRDADALIGLRADIAGSVVGIKLMLDDILPNITITREYEKPLAVVIEEAQNALEFESIAKLNPGAFRPASSVLTPPPIFETVVNIDLVKQMANPNSPLGKMLRDFKVGWGKQSKKPFAKEWRSDLTQDDLIKAANEGTFSEYSVTDEVRDWVTGGIKQEAVKDQPGWETFTSFDDVAAGEALAQLGLPRDVAKSVVLAMAAKAKNLTDWKTGELKVSPQVYSTEIIKAARAEMAEADKTFVAQYTRPQEYGADRATVSEKELFTLPQHAKLAEKVLEFAPYHAKPLDDAGRPMISKYEQQQINGTTKPLTRLDKVLAKLSSITGRPYGAPNSGMVERVNGADEVARLLQIDDAGHSNLIASAVNAKNVKAYFSAVEQQIIAATKPIDNRVLLGGDEIAARAESFDAAAFANNLVNKTASAQAGASRGDIERIAASMDAKMRKSIRDSIASAVEEARSSRGYSSFGADVDRRALHNVLQEVDRAGRAVKATDQEIALLKLQALSIAREELDKLGLVPVTGLAGNNVGRIKYSLNADSDWAYVGYGDVIDALRLSGNGQTAVRLLSEIMPNTGKPIRGVETGLIFPPNVIAEMGVLSLKLSETGLAPADISATLYYAMVESIGTIGHKDKRLFADILAGATGAKPMGENAARLAEIAKSLSNPRVAALLRETHLTNGARAYDKARGVSRAVADSVIAKIEKVRTSPTATLDDIVETIIGSTPAIRRGISNAGIPGDSMSGHLAKAEVQKAVNETFTTLEIGVARTDARMEQAFGEYAHITDPVLRQAAIRKAVSAENASLAAQRIKLIDEAVSRETAVRVSELLSDPTPENMVAAYEIAMNQLPSSMHGSITMAKGFFGGPEYNQLKENALKHAEEIAAEKAAIEEGMTVASVKRLAAENAAKEAREARKAARDMQLLAIRHELVTSIEANTPTANKNRARLAVVDAELERLNKMYDDLVPEKSFYDREKLPADIARENLSASAELGRGAKVAQALSGQAGKQDMFYIAARKQTAADNNINNFEANTERLSMSILKSFGVEAKRIPKGGLVGADDVKAKAAMEWGNKMFRTLFHDQVPIEVVLKGIKNAERRELVTEMYKLGSYIVGGGNIFKRAGLDSAWLNKYIVKGPLGDTKAAKFLMGFTGKQTHENLVYNIGQLLDAPTGKGGADWLTILKGYSWAFQRAAEIPTLAAEFSARFGHKAHGLTAQQALDAGYRAISSEGLLAQWLDPNQLFPPDYLRQLANMERYLEQIDNLIIDNGFVRAMDKVTGAIKSSVTLWRVGHHVVSIMGEYFMNLLAGVMNPAMYARAWKIQKSVGEFDSGKVFGHNYDIPLDDFADSYKMETFTGSNGDEGVRIMVAGKQRVIPFAEFYRMLEQKGLLLNNNTAEDIVMQGDNIMGSQNRLGGMLGDLQRANEGIGAFSARRDNLFRIAHAVDIAMKKPHRSLNAMIDDISINVQEYHPTMQMLSPFERKYMRRVAYFYTWQRNAMSVIARTMFENPANFTLAPKFIYEASSIGGEPQSIGQPMPNDPRLPGFASANGLGPHWLDESGKVYGFTLNAPQLDILSTIMGNLAYDPARDVTTNVTENLGMLLRENTLGQLNPIAGTALDLGYDAQYSGTGPRTVNDWGDYLVDKTGLGYISKATGVGLINNQGFLGARSDQKTDEERLQGGINALTGLRFTEWSKWYETAQRERNARLKVQQDELARKLGIMP